MGQMRLHKKEDYQRLLMELLAPVADRFSTGCARVRIPGAGACYGQDAIEMEAFARPLWGLVPYWAGGGTGDVFREKYQKGLVAGTDPEHPEYWGECGDFDQKFVEMAPIAFGLLLVPGILWDPLTPKEQERLSRWLYQINRRELPRCNWYFFRILVNLALRERGCAYSEEWLDSDLSYIDSCYLGDGWYVDGESGQKDYYSAFALQFYSLLYVLCAGEKDKERSRRYLERAAAFTGDFLYWFDETGAAIPFGRSLTYRFAQSAFWSAAVALGTKTPDQGVVKGIISRNIEYWLSQPIFHGDGTLSIGYTYPNLTMAERYNAPGSPYWCTKTFLILALADDHPFWGAEAAPLPALNPVRALPRADMLLQHRGKEVIAYVPGVYSPNPLGHFVEKYAKFAYSTVFGFSVSHSQMLLSEAAPDSMLAFIPEGEERVCVRQRSIRYAVLPDRIVSEWSPAAGILVETEIRPCGQGHLRRHRITSKRPCRVYDCGFAVSSTETGYQVSVGKDFIEVGNRLHGCRMERVSEGLEPYLLEADPNTSLLYKNTAIPALWRRLAAGETVIETKVVTWVNEKQEEV